MSTIVSNNVQIGQSGTATNNFTLYQPLVADGTVRLANGNTGSTTDLLRIKSDGNVALGNFTPSNNNAAIIKGIELGAAGNLIYGTGGSQSGLMTNLYYDGGWKVAQTGYPITMYYQLSGQHTFAASTYNTSAGNVGDAASVTNLLTLAKDKTLGLQGSSAGTGTGISFPATQNASSDANTLDDYEEGSWTPTLSFSGGSVGYSGRYGNYTKIGRQVTVTFWIYGNGVSSPSGAVTIANLPFSHAHESRPSLFLRTAQLTLTAGHMVIGWIPLGATGITLEIQYSGNLQGTLNASSITGTNFEFGGQISYFTS